MKKIVRHWLSVVLALAVLLAGVSAVVAENYTVSSTKLKVGANRVTAEADTTTIFAFKPTSVGLYEVSVDEPDAVTVTETTGEDGKVLELRVAPGDMGKVIGRQGRIAKEIRTIVKTVAQRTGEKITVEIVD